MVGKDFAVRIVDFLILIIFYDDYPEGLNTGGIMCLLPLKLPPLLKKIKGM